MYYVVSFDGCGIDSPLQARSPESPLPWPRKPKGTVAETLSSSCRTAACLPRNNLPRNIAAGGSPAMPEGPSGEKRPADAVARAVMAGGIAAGEIEDERAAASSAAAQLGSLGGKKRAATMSPERRAEVARKAAEARWRR